MTKRLVPASVTALLACVALTAGLPIFNRVEAAVSEPAAPSRVPQSVRVLLSNTAISRLPIFNRDAVIDAHRERQGQLLQSQQDIMNRAEAEAGRELTEAEQRDIEDMQNEFDGLERQVGLRERSIAQNSLLNMPQGRRTEPEPTDDDPVDQRPANRGAAPARAGAPVYPQARATAGGRRGFRSFGEFANCVRNASLDRETDPRLRNAAATTYGSEGVGSDGGFAVPPDFASEISSKVFSEDSLIGRCDPMPTSTNSKTLPVDNTTPWDTTSGIQCYWDGEAKAMTQSRPQLEEETTKTHKLHCLVPMTEELLEDAPAMDAYLRKKAPEKMDFSISDKIVRGTGSGMPLGFMNSPCFVSVPAEGAQAADTVITANISKMWSRMPVNSRASAIWLIHPDVEPQLDLLTVGQQPIYMGPNGIADTPYGRMKGRPVIPHQVCETLGDLGDIMLVDLKQYMALKKIGAGRDTNGFKAETSIHLWFDQDLVAFKFTFRLGGQPWWSKATDPRDGSSTQSPFIGLAAR